MAQYFTYSWLHREALRCRQGKPIGVAYGSQFARRGIVPGDEVFIVSVHHGRVYLLGKMLVRAVTHSAEDYRRLVSEMPEPAIEYLIAESCTPARLVPLPDEVTHGLRFLRGNQLVALPVRDEAHVEPQCLRSIRRLSPTSAAALDKLLPALVPFRPVRRVGSAPELVR